MPAKKKAQHTPYRLFTKAKLTAFQDDLLAWYSQCKRDLPWRDIDDPYGIWISEIMLQQTQVERVVDFYNRFLKRFPTVHELASASWEELLKYWRGLGYYNRARNLHRAAQVLIKNHGGKFPHTLEEALSLPGIGRYTAGAILSIAYGKNVTALDANIRRVLQRCFGNHPLEEYASQDALWWKVAEKVLRKGEAGEWNQALMDLGAQICSARNLACHQCPVAPYCQFKTFLQKHPYALQAEEKERVKLPKGTLEVAAAIIHRKGAFLVCQRPQGKNMAGFWEFPGGKRREGEDWRACLKREIEEELGVEIAVGLLYDSIFHEYDIGPILLRFYR